MVKTSVEKLYFQTYENDEDCSGRLILRRPDDENEVVRIHADEPFTLTLAWITSMGYMPMGGVTTNGCYPTATFIPETDARYLVTEIYTRERCGLLLLKERDGEYAEHVEFQPRRGKRGWTESTSWCD